MGLGLGLSLGLSLGLGLGLGEGGFRHVRRAVEFPQPGRHSGHGERGEGCSVLCAVEFPHAGRHSGGEARSGGGEGRRRLGR